MSQEKNNEGINLSEKYASVLVKPTEKVIATYGNDYFQNIVVSRNFNDFSFILTDKRLYYKGTNFVPFAQQLSIGRRVVEETLDLKDITKSGFEHFKYTPIVILIVGICLSVYIGLALGTAVFRTILMGFVLAMISLLIFSIYVKKLVIDKSYTVLKIDYAGGSLCGNIKLYGEESARDFLKQVKKAQDEYK